MNKDLDFETYLRISTDEFEIYLFDKKNLKSLYERKIQIKEKISIINYGLLRKFLDENIFKIEKLIGKFVTNIVLIVDNSEVLNLNLGIKKKNYQETLSNEFLESLLGDARDLFGESFQDQKIMHLLIKRYIVDGKQCLSIDHSLGGNSLCLELQIISISKNFIFEIDKVLEKYQIKVIQHFDGNYIKNLFRERGTSLAEITLRVQNGFIENEVKLIPKNIKKMGFFEKFFQLFS